MRDWRRVVREVLKEGLTLAAIVVSFALILLTVASIGFSIGGRLGWVCAVGIGGFLVGCLVGVARHWENQ